MFNKKKQIKKFGNTAKFDYDKNLFYYRSSGFRLKPDKQIHFEDIVAVELIIDNETVGKSGVGTAVAGGLIFGGTGLVLGGLLGRKNKEYISELTIKLITKEQEIIRIKQIETKTKANSTVAKTLIDQTQQICELLENIVVKNK